MGTCYVDWKLMLEGEEIRLQYLQELSRSLVSSEAHSGRTWNQPQFSDPQPCRQMSAKRQTGKGFTVLGKGLDS